MTTPLAIIALLTLMLTSTGCIVDTCNDCTPPPACTYGPNGVPGPAYFGLDWAGHVPDYVWTNNDAIPPVFRYGDYYNSLPGKYKLYYEGEFLDGCCVVNYQWDVLFDVWVNAGAAGGCGYVGADGLPSYLMLIMGPEGPGEHRVNKMAQEGVTVETISKTDDEIIMHVTKGDINVRITYTKLAQSKKATLDPAGVRTAEKK